MSSLDTSGNCVEVRDQLGILHHAAQQSKYSQDTCCRQLFVELQSGARFSADPKAFAQALNLDHTIQQVCTASCTIVLALCTHASNKFHALQDGQEFLKLLLSLLETKLAESGQPVRFVTCAFSTTQFCDT